MIELVLQRISPTSNDTIGNLYDENKVFFCNTMEDEKRDVKVKKETRIWADRYKLGIQKALTPLTQKYLDDPRLKPWFKRHIEILNIKGFQGVYIHIGNNEKHTDACVLLGQWSKIKTDRTITSSVATYKKFYQKYFPLLERGEEIFLTIKDEVEVIV